LVLRHQFSVKMYVNRAGETYLNPGVAYAEWDANLRTKIDFSHIKAVNARVVVTAVGNEAGSGKGIEVYDVTGTASICEVTWNGAAAQQGLAGSWTSVTKTADSVLTVRVKGSSATEDITVYVVELQVEYE